MPIPAWFNSSSALLKNAGWMLLSEGVSRATRLITIVAMAAFLSGSEYGVAMLALACHELFRVFMRAGAGPKIIQCADADLPSLVGSGGVLQWLILLCLAAVQIVSAPWLAHFYNTPELADLLQWMALSYLFYPLVSMRVVMLQRLNLMRHYSLRSALCVMVENLSIALLLVFGAGIKAVAIAKILAAMAWVLVFHRLPVPHYPLAVNPQQILMLVRYSGNVLGSELMRSLRSQLDMIIAGRLLSPELLGIYSFAKSAGVGLSQSLSSAWLGVLYPYICKQQRQLAVAFNPQRILLMSTGIGGIFVVQALLAPLYIRYLFAPRWHDSAALVSLLCLTAIPALLVETEACVLRARAQLARELVLMSLGVGLSAAGLLLVAPNTPMGLAICLLITSLLWLGSFAHRFFVTPLHPLTRAIA